MNPARSPNSTVAQRRSPSRAAAIGALGASAEPQAPQKTKARRALLAARGAETEERVAARAAKPLAGRVLVPAVRAPRVMDLGRGPLGGAGACPVPGRCDDPLRTPSASSRMPAEGAMPRSRRSRAPYALYAASAPARSPAFARRRIKLPWASSESGSSATCSRLRSRAAIEVSGALRLVRQPTEYVELLQAMALPRLVHPIVIQVREELTTAEGRGLPELSA